MNDTPDVVRVDRLDAVALLTLNRPDKLNAADRALHRRLAEVWDEVAAEDAVRAIVLTGAGRAFSAGGDGALLQAMTADAALRSEVLQEAGEIVRAMLRCPLPIVAAVNGPAVGLGWSLVGVCDLVVMADDTFFADPHVSLGLVAADGGAVTLPLTTGLTRAKEFVLLGERVSARDALRFGLANRVVPRDQVVEEAMAIAQRLAALPAQAVQATRAVLNVQLTSIVDLALDDALAAEAESFTTDDFARKLDELLAR
jgi:enoyl-CoA hydratase